MVSLLGWAAVIGGVIAKNLSSKPRGTRISHTPEAVEQVRQGVVVVRIGVPSWHNYFR
jgi:hypothetical protein